jgi:small nuclear ribonucleoprotein (snRNP)-like protein
MVVGLGTGKHVLVKYGSGRKVRGTVEMIDAHHFTLLPDHQSASLQLSYDHAWQVQPNPIKGTKMLIAVAAFLAFVVVLGAMVAD